MGRESVEINPCVLISTDYGSIWNNKRYRKHKEPRFRVISDHKDRETGDGEVMVWKCFLYTIPTFLTGLYDTPTLWVHPGPEVTLGENVTFSCHLKTATSKFFLLKERESNHIQHKYGNIQAEFPMGPVTRAHRGTYRCFGSYNDYAWSFPSEPVTLLITGKDIFPVS